MILSMFLLWKYWQLSSSSSFTSLLIHSLEIHAIFWGIEAYLRRIKTSPRAVHAGSTPVASKRTNSDGSGVVPQQLIPPGALGHFFPLVTPMGGEAALSGRKRKRLLSPSGVRINWIPGPENLTLPKLPKLLAARSLERLLFWSPQRIILLLVRSLFLVAMTLLLVLNRFYFIHRFHCFVLTPWLSTQFGLLIFNKLKTLQTNLQKNPFEIWRRFSYSFFDFPWMRVLL